MQGKKVVISGGVGFIGSNLAIELVSRGAHVTVVDSLIEQYGGNVFNLEDIKDQIVLNVSDIRDRYSLEYLVRDVDYIFNLAGQTSHMDSMTDPYTDLEINCLSQLSLLEVCRNVNKTAKIVFASTRQIYGRPQYLPVDENHPIVPVDVNGINKNAGEQYHQLYNDVYGLPTVSLRLTNTYGPRMRVKDNRQTFLGIWVKNMLTNTPVQVWGGAQLRDFNYVDDVVAAMIMCAESDAVNGQVLNLGSEEVISLLEVARILSELSGGEYEVVEFPSERKKIDIGDYYGNFDLIEQTIGWKPQVNLKSGLKLTLDYYAKNLEKYL